MEFRSYHRIDDDGDGDKDNEENVVHSPLQSVVSASHANSGSERGLPSSSKKNKLETVTIKVLKGEQSKEITVPRQASVAQLKSLVDPAYDVPASQQRLVFKGKPLRPDEDSLASFHVMDGAVLHLFPLPPSAVPSAAAATSATSSLYNFSSVYGNSHVPGIPRHLMRPIHFVPEVVQSIREVKMWCYILIITSCMDIFTNLSYRLSTGHMGRGHLDTIVRVLQMTFSFVGLHVGQLGLRCTTTTEAESIKQYVFSLGGLAVVSAWLKALWVVDVILLAKKGLREAAEEEEEDLGQDDGRGKGGGGYPGDEPAEEELSDSSFMIYFGIQVAALLLISGDSALSFNCSLVFVSPHKAIIMACITVSMWVACVSRARAFQQVVQSYEGIATRA